MSNARTSNSSSIIREMITVRPFRFNFIYIFFLQFSSGSKMELILFQKADPEPLKIANPGQGVN